MTPAAQPLLADRLDQVLDLLRADRIDASTADTFQRAIARAFSQHGFTYDRDVRFGPPTPLDFLLPGGIGIALRTHSYAHEVERDLARYALSDRVTALVLVTTRPLHQAMPTVMNGKPVRVHCQRARQIGEVA